MKKYMCGVTFLYELGETDEIAIYDTIVDLKKFNCWKNCGIVEIETDGEPEKYTSFKWIEPRNMNWGKEDVLKD